MMIDFSERKLLKETWMEMLGSWSKTLLKMMYGDDVQIVANLNDRYRIHYLSWKYPQADPLV